MSSAVPGIVRVNGQGPISGKGRHDKRKGARAGLRDVARGRWPTRELPAHLQALYAGFPFDRSVPDDPLSLVRPLAVDRRSAEIAGIFAATLAIGRAASIRRAFATWNGLSGGDLGAFVARSGRPAREGAIRAFRHRWIRGDQLAYLGYRLHEIQREHGGLEELFRSGFEGPHGFAGGLDALAHGLRGDGEAAARVRPPAGYRILFPSPLESARSPCKRETLFVRWMVRTDVPDLGVWSHIPPSELRVPLDLHVYWIARNLGLTRRKTPSWAAVEEITAALRSIDPVDPVRFDFVLCHTGISGDCPKHREVARCGPCAVRPDCRLWHGRPWPGPSVQEQPLVAPQTVHA
jgi:uncharacterized protein (TIGR02757 family)